MAGYSSGALALGQSIKDVGSKLHRVVMVTPDVPESSREPLSHLWEVIEIEPIFCNHKHNLTGDKYDLKGERYQEGLSRWATTCTKFAAWTLVQFERIIYMDSDTLVVGPIDDALYSYSNASFVASPESFPPDTFNSGFMVIKPSLKSLNYLLNLNARVGSAEGGDQGVLNNGLCPNWFTANSDDPYCGRLPWLFNVQAAYYMQYKTLRVMTGDRTPSVIHFVSDGKPWKVLMYEYAKGVQLPDSTMKDIGKQAECHLLWRQAFFRATSERPTNNAFLIRAVEILNGAPLGPALPNGSEKSSAQGASIGVSGSAAVAASGQTKTGSNKKKRMKSTQKSSSSN